MPRESREILRGDILAPEDYGARRQDLKRRNLDLKKNRRVQVGPDATFYFENYDTMWMQIQEMLHIEKGGDAQIADELAAYNPLVPKGRELVATLMFEIVDEGRRDRLLRQRGGVEHTITLKIADQVIAAVPEGDIERTNTAGKTSSVHFLHFPFTDEQVERFRDLESDAVLGFSHENYAHMAVLSRVTRNALADDFS